MLRRLTTQTCSLPRSSSCSALLIFARPRNPARTSPRRLPLAFSLRPLLDRTAADLKWPFVFLSSFWHATRGRRASGAVAEASGGGRGGDWKRRLGGTASAFPQLVAFFLGRGLHVDPGVDVDACSTVDWTSRDGVWHPGRVEEEQAGRQARPWPSLRVPRVRVCLALLTRASLPPCSSLAHPSPSSLPLSREAGFVRSTRPSGVEPHGLVASSPRPAAGSCPPPLSRRRALALARLHSNARILTFSLARSSPSKLPPPSSGSSRSAASSSSTTGLPRGSSPSSPRSLTTSGCVSCLCWARLLTRVDTSRLVLNRSSVRADIFVPVLLILAARACLRSSRHSLFLLPFLHPSFSFPYRPPTRP